MKNVITCLFILVFTQLYGQSEPSRNDALAVLKKYNYALYVSKKTGVPVGQLKFVEHNNMYTGDEALYRYKTRAAKQYYWPNDRLVYTFKIVTPKDKDGIQTKYHFEVKYALSKCLTDGYGCILMNTWELESALKFGPFFIGAKNVDNQQVVELIKDRCKNEKETVLKELENIDVENWIEIESILPANSKYKNYKEEVISKTKRKNYFLFTVVRANFDRHDPKINTLIPTEYKAEVTCELIDGTWKITEMFARSGGKFSDEVEDVKKMYTTFKEGNFDDIFEKRSEVDFPPESCTAISRAASLYYHALKTGEFKTEAFKSKYVNEAAYQKDVNFFNYLETNGFTIKIDSNGFSCSSFDSFPSYSLIIEVKHEKFKGKLMKDWNAKSASLSNGSSSSLSLTRYGYFRINAQFEMELIKGRWKMKAIADQVLPDL